LGKRTREIPSNLEADGSCGQNKPVIDRVWPLCENEINRRTNAPAVAG